MIPTNTFVHPTSIIDEGAIIGELCNIWHFCHIMPKARIGNNCTLGQNVFIASNAELGNGCKVQNNVSIYEGVICKDNVFIGPSVVFTNVLTPRAFINRKAEFVKTTVCTGASIGANATIVCGTTIGEYALVAAGAVVTKQVPSFTIVAGNPAKVIGYISAHGERLIFNKDKTTGTMIANCPRTGETYTLINGTVARKREE